MSVRVFDLNAWVVKTSVSMGRIWSEVLWQGLCMVNHGPHQRHSFTGCIPELVTGGTHEWPTNWTPLRFHVECMAHYRQLGGAQQSKLSWADLEFRVTIANSSTDATLEVMDGAQRAGHEELCVVDREASDVVPTRANDPSLAGETPQVSKTRDLSQQTQTTRPSLRIQQQEEGVTPAEQESRAHGNRPVTTHQGKGCFKEQKHASSLPGSTFRVKTIPVYKWGHRFDNESGQSVAAFLERVKELKQARGVNSEELFVSAVDLFSGPALIWYRSTLPRVNSWRELCTEMKIVFRSPDYDFRLHKRTNPFTCS
uniref:Retrotransposon gag domain-containing protein n=1 Tax=Timema cristinae TaxID=61476 RepID=A0A7R9CUE9_TIMCR|nr:unnamed protein product [Timema cristinae]